MLTARRKEAHVGSGFQFVMLLTEELTFRQLCKKALLRHHGHALGAKRLQLWINVIDLKTILTATPRTCSAKKL